MVGKFPFCAVSDREAAFVFRHRKRFVSRLLQPAQDPCALKGRSEKAGAVLAVLKPLAKLRGLMLAQGMGKHEVLEGFLSSVCWAPCALYDLGEAASQDTTRADETLLHPGVSPGQGLAITQAVVQHSPQHCSGSQCMEDGENSHSGQVSVEQMDLVETEIKRQETCLTDHNLHQTAELEKLPTPVGEPGRR